MRRLVIAVGWLTLATAAEAQSDWAAIHQLAGGSAEVRVDAGHRKARGMVHHVTDSSIDIKNAYGEIAHFNRQDVRRIERVMGGANAKRRGAIVGFVIGAGLSTIATVSSGERGDRRRHELPVLYGVTMGGGALLGALLADAEQTELLYVSAAVP